MSDYTDEELVKSIKGGKKINYTATYNPETFWKSMGSWYHTSFGSNDPKRSDIMENIKGIIGRIHEIGDVSQLLEVGCGFGRCMPFILETCKNVKKVTGVEFSPTMIKNSKVYLGKFPKGGIEIIQGNAKKLPFEDKSFDLVYTHVCLTHIPPKDIPRVTSEISRVARRYILQVERFKFPYEHPSPHRWSHLLAPMYLDLGWEIMEHDVIHKEHDTKVLVLRR